MATPSLVGSGMTNGTFGTGPIVLSAWASIAADDIEILEVRGRPDVTVAGTPTITVPSDWHLIGTHIEDWVGDPRDVFLGLWWRRSTGSTATISITCSNHFAGGSQGCHATRSVFRDVLLPPAVLDSSTGGATSATYTAPGVTAPASDCLVITATNTHATGTGTSAMSTPNGFSAQHRGLTSHNCAGGIAWKALTASPGAVTMPVWGLSGTIVRSAISAVFAYMPNTGWSVGFLKF